MDKRDTQISKSLTYLLRHGAVKEKLPIDANGYVPLQALLVHNRLKSHRCNLEDVHRIVDTNEKKRYNIKFSPQGQELICATQGHSIKSVRPTEEVLHEIKDSKELPSKLIHGTTISKAILILQTGAIKKFTRNHVHLSPGITGIDALVVSGMRASSNVHIHVKLGDELLNHLKVYKSLNHVYLVPSDVPVTLFDKLVIRSSCDEKTAGKELAQLLALLKDQQIHYALI